MGKRFLTAASLLLLAASGSLQAQTIEERLSALEARMDSIEQRVTRLESFHPQREFTITQGNFTLDEFNAYVTALDVKDGDWVYIKGTGKMDGDNRLDSMEMCTSDPNITSAFGYYLNGNPEDTYGRRYYFSENSESNQTFVKMKYTNENIDLDWGAASSVTVETYKNERIAYNIHSSINGGGFSVFIIPQFSSIHFSQSLPENKLLIKAGSTRMEACGF